MAESARRLGVKLRPHAKTHKLPEAARLQLGMGATGLTVAKTAEAEVMADAGISDLFIAYTLVSDSKIGRILSLASRPGMRLIAAVDSLEGARWMAAAALGRGMLLEVRLKVDTGMRRTGVAYDDAVALAKEIAALEGLALTGIYTYRGAMLGGRPTRDLRAAGLEEGRLMASLAEDMRTQGITIADVSVGSTPTALYAAEVEGVTEIRPGTYIYQDAMQAALGVCPIEACAGAVRVTVVSRPAADRVIVDGGSKTFATDVQPGQEPHRLTGFGHVLEAPDALFERMSEEHGVLRVSAHHPFAVGDVLHIIPNHICSTVNLHDSIYWVAEEGTVSKLQVAARGKLE
jgi:D-serine deaminase-like pyridoxal phosphate-dependent protein